MAYKVEFCEGCAFAGLCSNKNEAYVAPWVERNWRFKFVTRGLVVSWQDTDGNSTSDVYVRCKPANGRSFTPEEEAEACYQAAVRFDECPGPGTQNLLVDKIAVCGTFRTMANISPHMRLQPPTEICPVPCTEEPQIEP